ncbi:MAG TPA: glycosyltransferase family 4 protein [Vicinamibacterales bacterium]|nr:glycosyltransferase family 4 protein [Vicinamibacterales bacterium]
MRQPRVAIVAASLDIIGGQGVQAHSLVEAMRADGGRVAFVPIDPRFPRPFRWLRKYPGIRTIVNQSLYLPALTRLAATDVVHVFSASYASFLLAPVPAMTVGRALRKHVVLHYHSGEADDHLSNWGALVHPWLKLAHQIVVPSEYLRRVFAKHGHEAQVVPNVIDLSRFPYRERRTLAPRLLSARNLEPHYRIDVIIEAFARIKERIPDATLTIAGYGSLEPQLRLLVESRRLDGVRFVGKIAPANMARLYDEADIFLNASVVDNQPVSILEAFASGLPVISTPTGDIESMVRHQHSGLIVPPFDPVAMAAAVGWMLDHPDRARTFARNALQSTSRFTWDAIRPAWAEIYNRSVRPRTTGTWTPQPRMQ